MISWQVGAMIVEAALIAVVLLRSLALERVLRDLLAALRLLFSPDELKRLEPLLQAARKVLEE